MLDLLKFVWNSFSSNCLIVYFSMMEFEFVYFWLYDALRRFMLDESLFVMRFRIWLIHSEGKILDKYGFQEMIWVRFD